MFSLNFNIKGLIEKRIRSHFAEIVILFTCFYLFQSFLRHGTTLLLLLHLLELVQPPTDPVREVRS